MSWLRVVGLYDYGRYNPETSPMSDYEINGQARDRAEKDSEPAAEVKTFVDHFVTYLPLQYQNDPMLPYIAASIAGAMIHLLDKRAFDTPPQPDVVHKHTHYHLDKNHFVAIAGDVVRIEPAPLYKVEQAREAVAEAEARVKEEDDIVGVAKSDILWYELTEDGVRVSEQFSSIQTAREYVAGIDKAMDAADASYGDYVLKDIRTKAVVWERKGRTP